MFTKKYKNIEFLLNTDNRSLFMLFTLVAKDICVVYLLLKLNVIINHLYYTKKMNLNTA